MSRSKSRWLLSYIHEINYVYSLCHWSILRHSIWRQKQIPHVYKHHLKKKWVKCKKEWQRRDHSSRMDGQKLSRQSSSSSSGPNTEVNKADKKNPKQNKKKNKKITTCNENRTITTMRLSQICVGLNIMLHKYRCVTAKWPYCVTSTGLINNNHKNIVAVTINGLENKDKSLCSAAAQLQKLVTYTHTQHITYLQSKSIHLYCRKQ